MTKRPLLFSFLFALLISSPTFAQNKAPQISNLTASVDWQLKIINLNFDVSDLESDPLEVVFKVSDDGGKTFFYSAANTTGDVGFPITPSNGKSIVWDYNDSVVNFSSFIFLIEANDRNTINIQDIVDQVDSIRLYDNVSFMEGKRHQTAGPVLLQATRDSVYNRFSRYELLPWIQSFSFGGGNGENITGKLPGMTDEATTYIVDAHYDGVSSGPAADDNASGVAGVLEAARVLSQYSFDKSIRFIAFDLEEAGLLGSISYVNANGIPAGENINGVLNFEMIGYYSERPNSQTLPAGFNVLFPATYAQLSADNFRGNFISSVGNTASSSLNGDFKNSAQLYVPQLKVIDIALPGNGTIAPDFRRSDHAPFWDASYQALMLTDGANFRNANYHSANDVKDSLDFRFMTRVVKATVATLASLAGPRNSDVQFVKVSNPIGLFDRDWDCDVNIHHQKKDNTIVLKFSDCIPKIIDLQLIDQEGKLIVSKKTTPVDAAVKLKIESKLTSGVYILKVINEKGQWFTQKIVLD